MPEALTEWTHWNERGLEKAWEHAKNNHDKRQTTVWVLFQSFLNIKKSFFWDVYLVSLCLQLMTGTKLTTTPLKNESLQWFNECISVTCTSELPWAAKLQLSVRSCCKDVVLHHIVYSDYTGRCLTQWQSLGHKQWQSPLLSFLWFGTFKNTDLLTC